MKSVSSALTIGSPWVVKAKNHQKSSPTRARQLAKKAKLQETRVAPTNCPRRRSTKSPLGTVARYLAALRGRVESWKPRKIHGRKMENPWLPAKLRPNPAILGPKFGSIGRFLDQENSRVNLLNLLELLGIWYNRKIWTLDPIFRSPDITVAGPHYFHHCLMVPNDLPINFWFQDPTASMDEGQDLLGNGAAFAVHRSTTRKVVGHRAIVAWEKCKSKNEEISILSFWKKKMYLGQKKCQFCFSWVVLKRVFSAMPPGRVLGVRNSRDAVGWDTQKFPDLRTAVMLPSGKSSFLMGKSTINGHFQ